MPTVEHRRIVDFIRHFTAENGYGPTYGEIRDALGYRSIGPVQYRIRQLVAWGYLSRVPGQARAIRILRAPGGTERRKSSRGVAARARTLLGALVPTRGRARTA